MSDRPDASPGTTRGGLAEAGGAPPRFALASSFAAAAEASGGVVVEQLAMADASLRLSFASPALRERVAPAFAHLLEEPAEAGRPHLDVHLWDSASTGAPAPPRPTVPEGGPPGALYHFHEPPVRSVYQPGLEALSVLDAEKAVAWYWVSGAAQLPYWEQACPIRQLLFWWLESRGYLQLHGGAVGTESGGVLLVGKAGSGKSTTALASLGSDLLYAADDYVAATLEPSPRVQSLYNSGKLEADHAHALLPRLVPLLANAERLGTEKAVIYAQQHFPDGVTAGFPLRAVLVPKIIRSRRETRIVPATRATAFAALAPSTMVQLHTAGADTWAAMSRLIETVPSHGLELGSDVAAIPEVIGDFLARLSSSSDG